MKNFSITLAFLMSLSIANAQRLDVTYVRPNTQPKSLENHIQELEELVSHLCFPNESNFDHRVAKSFGPQGWGKADTPRKKIDFMTRFRSASVFEIRIEPVKATSEKETWALEIKLWKIEKENLKEITVSRISVVIKDPTSEKDYAVWLTTLRRDFSAAMNNTIKELLEVELFRVAKGVDRMVADDYVEDIPRLLVNNLKLEQLRPTFCHQRKNLWHIKGDISKYQDRGLSLRVVLNGSNGIIHDGPFLCKLDHYDASVKEIALKLQKIILAHLPKPQE
jgi:hypothetical protein